MRILSVCFERICRIVCLPCQNVDLCRFAVLK